MQSFWPHFELREGSRNYAVNFSSLVRRKLLQFTVPRKRPQPSATVRAKPPQRYSYAGVFKAALMNPESCCRLSYSSTQIYLCGCFAHRYRCGEYYSTQISAAQVEFAAKNSTQLSPCILMELESEY